MLAAVIDLKKHCKLNNTLQKLSNFTENYRFLQLLTGNSSISDPIRSEQISKPIMNTFFEKPYPFDF